MKFKRIALLMLVFSILGAGAVFANTALERFSAKKVTVKVNQQKLDKVGLEVDLSDDQKAVPMASIHELAASLGGIVTAEGNTYTIYKPNVQLSLIVPKTNESYSKFEKGKHYLQLRAQVDSLAKDISSVKISILDPWGNEVYNLEDSEAMKALKNLDGESNQFIYKSNLEMNFKFTGNYTVNFSMKLSGSAEYAQVAQMVVQSTKP